jgi:hypothetical protein
LEKNEEEQSNVYNKIENNINNLDYSIYNYIKGTTGKHKEAGIIWIVRTLVEQQSQETNKIKSSLASSFSIFVNNNNSTQEMKNNTPIMSQKERDRTHTTQNNMSHKEHTSTITSIMYTDTNAYTKEI